MGSVLYSLKSIYDNLVQGHKTTPEQKNNLKIKWSGVSGAGQNFPLICQAWIFNIYFSYNKRLEFD